MSERLVVVSADGHAGGPPSAYKDYIESRYLDDLKALDEENDAWLRITITSKGASKETLDLIDGRGAIRSDGELGAWDIDRRIKELDAEGVAAELLLSGHQCSTLPFFGVVNTPYSAELREAGTRAYHRWLADGIFASKGRLFGVAEPGTCLDMDATVKELRWAADHGFVGVLAPGMVADPALPRLNDSYYEPFWQTCAELGLVVTIHAGWGGTQGQFQSFLEMMQKMTGGAELDAQKQAEIREKLVEQLHESAESPLQLDLGPRRVLWLLMIGGVFDRNPGLKLALTEVRADWVPATLKHLDQRFAAADSPLLKTPSEYFAQNCVVAPSSPHKAEIEMRHEIGVNNMLFGMDYPHPEGTWPNTQDWIRDAFRGVPENEARAILGENAIDVFGLDRAKLTEVASRIGPTVESVLGEHSVSEELVAHFHQRSGYSRPAEVVETSTLDAALDEDLALLPTGA